MKRHITLAAALLLPLMAAPALAQRGDSGSVAQAGSPKSDSSKSEAKKANKSLFVPTIEIDHIRPNDARGLNVFEPSKESQIPYTGFKISAGAAFTQQFQGLQHSNTATPVLTNGVNQNALMSMGHGFNNAVANAYLNAQLAPGIRVAMTSYLSARHHQETWVKDGYFLIDDSPIDNPLLHGIMKYTTLKVGHFEVNYGDAHFRRTDNGQAMFNPLVGNYVLDAFAPQVGAEAYLRSNGLMAMVGVTNGEEKGMVQSAAKRAPAFLGKLGVDKQISPLVRVRLTGSLYDQARAANQVLYSGDRAGSRYYDVLENTASNEKDNAWSGSIQPFSGPSGGVHARVVNPFVKVGPVEYFGNYEKAVGKSATEASWRTVKQNVNELTLRLPSDFYLSGRYNTVSGRLAGQTQDFSVKRSQIGGGWFVTPAVLAKLEYVNQKYNDFVATDIRNGGQFKGFMIEGTVAF